jgi:hypothetical protein
MKTVMLAIVCLFSLFIPVGFWLSGWEVSRVSLGPIMGAFVFWGGYFEMRKVEKAECEKETDDANQGP